MATQNNWGRHTFFMCVLFLMAAAAIAMSAIVLHRMLNDDDSDDSPTSAGTGRPVSGAEVGNPPTTPTRSTPLPDSRQGAVVDCLPRNLREPRQDVTRGECERRQWVYKYLVVYWGAPVESLLYRHLTVFTDLIWNIYITCSRFKVGQEKHIFVVYSKMRFRVTLQGHLNLLCCNVEEIIFFYLDMQFLHNISGINTSKQTLRYN